MARISSKKKILKEYNDYLRRIRKSELKLKLANLRHNWAQRASAKKLQEKFSRNLLEQAGISKDILEEHRNKEREAREKFLSKHQEVIAKKVEETATRHRHNRAMMGRRRELLEKLNGHSPLVAWSCTAHNIWRDTLISAGRGGRSIDEGRFVSRRAARENYGTAGGQLETISRGAAHLTQLLNFQYIWLGRTDGLLRAQAHVQVNGTYDISAIFGFFRNVAQFEINVYLRVAQTGSGGVRREARSAPLRICRERVDGGGWEWWGESRTSYIDAEVMIECPAIEIEARRLVIFTVEVEVEMVADDGADLTLNLCDDDCNVISQGVVFTVED